MTCDLQWGFFTASTLRHISKGDQLRDLILIRLLKDRQCNDFNQNVKDRQCNDFNQIVKGQTMQ